MIPSRFADDLPATPPSQAALILSESKDKLLKIMLLITVLAIAAKWYLG